MHARLQLTILAALILLAASLHWHRQAREGAAARPAEQIGDATKEETPPARPGEAPPDESQPVLFEPLLPPAAFSNPTSRPRASDNPVDYGRFVTRRPIPAPSEVTFGSRIPAVDPGRYAVSWEHAAGNRRLNAITIVARPPEQLVGKIAEIRFWSHWLPGSGPWRKAMEPTGDGSFVGHATCYQNPDMSGIRPLIEIVLKDGRSCEIGGEVVGSHEDYRRSFLFHYDWRFWKRS